MSTHSTKLCVPHKLRRSAGTPSSASADEMCLLYTWRDWSTWIQLTGGASQYFWRWANTSVSCCHRSKPTFKTTYKPSEHSTHICYDHLTYLDKSQIKACRIIYLSHSRCCWLQDLICLNWEKLCKWASSPPQLRLHSEYWDAAFVQQH